MLINMAFSGGGIKGLAYVGALRFFEERGYKVNKASGTSVGAIFAALTVSGYKSHEIAKIISSIELETLKERNSIKAGFKSKGIYSINNLEDKIAEILAKKNIYNFLDLKRGNEYLLQVIVTDNRRKKPIVIPNDLSLYGFDCDLFPVAKAVAMSCSIPFFYSTYKLNNNYFSDGGIYYSFPLELVCDNKYPVYGLKLSKIMYKMRSTIQNKGIHIINIDCLNFKMSQFKKGLEEKQKLYLAGYESVRRYFNNN